ncbi:MAG: PqqD family protein [Bacteroidales bacterium]|nr:PqqD family protein [Bacteroidales bacterium]
MKINPNIAINENGLLFNPSTGESFRVNPTGARVAELLKEERSLDVIISKIQEEYEVDRYTLEKDIADFIQLLKNNALIQNNE